MQCPDGRVDGREEGVGIGDRGMDMGDVELVRLDQRALVGLRTADNKALTCRTMRSSVLNLLRGRGIDLNFFRGNESGGDVRHLYHAFRGVEMTFGYDNVPAAGKGAADGKPCLIAHYDGTAHGYSAEILQVR